MVRALVLYHTLHGNTGRLAEGLADGLRTQRIETDCLGIHEINVDKIRGYDFLAIGGPTHNLGLSKDMKAFLQKLQSLELKGMSVFSFDTRTDLPMNNSRLRFLENSAAKRIEATMRRLKMKVIRPRESGLVGGTRGPLESSAEDAFIQIGKDIGALLTCT
ncbi:MAG: flavodoxin family protein [Candidatus Odinarchaeota archaeon]